MLWLSVFHCLKLKLYTNSIRFFQVLQNFLLHKTRKKSKTFGHLKNLENGDEAVVLAPALRSSDRLLLFNMERILHLSDFSL